MASGQGVVLHAVEGRGMEFHHFIKQVMLGNVLKHFEFGFKLGPASDSIKDEEFLDQFSDSYLLKKSSAHGV